MPFLKIFTLLNMYGWDDEIMNCCALEIKLELNYHSFLINGNC